MKNLPEDLHPKIVLNLIMEERKKAYFSESDPYFMEAFRKDASGDLEGAEIARKSALQKVTEIKARYPLLNNA
ncbi:hypothetical protein I6F48_03530 [Pseudoalteromonas sp. SWYJ118]|uniref:hypothetical protein n=1 Tax=Pseudoalteromonas sp. SWYJ118 TaxID=2792062 RepID=UPI0018CF6B6A|nr:hypothetical protein [Pseudoalteromonas sp. SWYJ118]MBH0074634.1 hypothetical protein [Pseudoalteromonas sp. SWYJ118]